MPINILITFIIGSILGWLVIHITRAPQHLRGLIVGCSAAGNLGNLLLIIIPAVCKEKGSPFGAPESGCLLHLWTCLCFSFNGVQIGSIYIWTYVYNIVRISSGSSNSSGTPNGFIHESFRKSSESDLEAYSEPKLVSNHMKSEDDTDQYVLLSTTSEVKDEILGLIIGMVPQIRMSLIGDEAPLCVIQDSASFLGDAAIPSLTLIIGGNLLKGLQGSGVKISIIISIIICRYIILPLSGIFIIKGAIQLGLVQYDDTQYQFVLLIQYALPPAMNIGERVFRHHAVDLCLGFNRLNIVVNLFLELLNQNEKNGNVSGATTYVLNFNCICGDELSSPPLETIHCTYCTNYSFIIESANDTYQSSLLYWVFTNT